MGKIVPFAVMFATLAAPVLGAPDRQDLKTQLLELYEVTKTGRDELRVTSPGTVLVIQKEGITGNPSTEITEAMTVVENGEIGQKKGFLAKMSAKKSTRSFAIGERVYITRFFLGPEHVTVYITTVDTRDIMVDGNTKQARYNGEVRFMFPPKVLATSTGAEVKKVIDPVLAVEAELASAEPPTIELGQPPEAIEGILGKPVRIVKAADKIMWIYSDLKITFVDGKVSEIE